MDVIVVGGGVIGCSIAYHLQRAGAMVTLVDRGPIGNGASSAAAGMLAPLAESPEPGPFSRLALLGLEAFHRQAGELMDESGIDFEFRRDGVLRVAESAGEESRLRQLLSLQSPAAPAAELLDRRSVLELEPALGPTVTAALYMPHEGHVNPARLTASLAAAAGRRGTRILEGWAVEQFIREGSHIRGVAGPAGTLHADVVVLAGGAWTAATAATLAAPIPVAPVRGQMVAIQTTPAPIRRIVYSHDGYLVPKADGSIFVGATEEHDGRFDTIVTVDGLHGLLGAAKRLVPALAGGAYLRSWAGLRPCSPDRLPILGSIPGAQDCYVASGHFRNGILLSLITGRLMAALITGASSPPELTPFSPERFTT